jgi:hypothetical protein
LNLFAKNTPRTKPSLFCNLKHSPCLTDRCKIIMATLAELYEFLETKQDDSHLDSRFSYDAFLPVEQPKARLEM